MDIKEEKRKYHYYLMVAFVIWLILNLIILKNIQIDWHGNSDFYPSMIELIGLIIIMTGIMVLLNRDYYSKKISDNKLVFRFSIAVILVTGFVIFIMAFLYTMVLCL